MTEQTFSELVNLYLDKEMSPEDLEALKAELQSNPERKDEFKERCRLHQAMRLAMREPQVSSRKGSAIRSSRLGGSTRSRSRSGSRQKQSASKRSSRKVSNSDSLLKRSIQSGQRVTTNKQADPANVFHMPRWITGLGLAACLAMGGIFLYPVFTDTTHVSKQQLEGVTELELEAAADPLSAVDRSQLKRFASNQKREPRRSSSLAAELRLLGLHPGVMDDDAELSEVSMASIQPRDVSHRRIEVFNQLKHYSPLPEPQILETPQTRRLTTQWPAGFQSSLASFK